MPGSTHVTHEDACTPSACVPLQELRTTLKIVHLSFKEIIIINYYPFLEVSPLDYPLGPTLGISFHFSSPIPLLTMWNLSPPSLIHCGRSARGSVYIFINNVHR